MTFTTVTSAARVVGAQLAWDVKVKADEVKSPTEVSKTFRLREAFVEARRPRHLHAQPLDRRSIQLEGSIMSTTATTLPTGTWNVDPSHSRVGFRVKHLGISNVRGEFHDFDGQFVIAGDGTATASGTVRVASVDTNEGNRDAHLKSADFFDADTYPEISFRATSSTATH